MNQACLCLIWCLLRATILYRTMIWYYGNAIAGTDISSESANRDIPDDAYQ
jgi:hypothetical protein